MFSKTVIFLYILISSAIAQGLGEQSCRHIFTYKRHIVRIHKNYVFRVRDRGRDFAYKIFSGVDGHLAYTELESLNMFSALLKAAAPKAILKVSQGVRVTKRNEYLLLDTYWAERSGLGPYDATPSLQNRLMLVTKFERGISVEQFLSDPTISIDSKKRLIAGIQQALEQVVVWLAQNPQFTYKGKPIRVTLETPDKYGEVYEYPSSDGIFEYEYQSVMFETPRGENRAMVTIDSISNLIIRPDGSVVLFDPY